MSAFNFTNNVFNKIRITVAGSGSGMYFDYFQLQGGITTTIPIETDPIAINKTITVNGTTQKLNDNPIFSVTNANIGSGYRLAVPNTNNIKTLFNRYGLLFDSTTNTNGISAYVDTSLLETKLRSNTTRDSLGAIIDTKRTQAQVRTDISLTTTGSSGASTYNNSTGVLNIPQYSGGTTTNALTMNNSGSGDASGTTFNGSAARTLSYNTIGAQQALTLTTTSTAGAATLSSGTLNIPRYDLQLAQPAGQILRGTGTSSYSDTFLITDTTKHWLTINRSTGLGVLDIYPTFPGTVATTSASATVTGTNTRFLSNFALGDSILINGIYRVVQSIASNTSLTLYTNFPSTLSSQSYTNPAAARGVYRINENSVIFRYGNPFITVSDSLKNLYFGSGAGAANTTGNLNLAIGSGALGSATTAGNNVAIGALALRQSGGQNVAIGAEALTNAGSSTAQDIAIGYRAMFNNTQVSCLAIGYTALSAGTGTGTTNNIGIGNFVMANGTITGSGNVFGGVSAASVLTSGANNTGWGNGTQSTLSTGSRNTSLGSVSLTYAGTASDQTALGYGALQFNRADGNTGVGSQSIANASLSTQETAVGYKSGQTVTGVSSIAVTNGGSGYTTATVSVALSTTNFAGATATATVSGGAVTAITVVTSGSGYTTAPVVTISGDGTGATATATLTTGGSNTSIGYQAGFNSNYGLRNIYIGNNAKGVLNSNDKLYLDNADNGTSSFLYGDMTSGAKWLKVNGGFGDNYVAKTSTYSITNNDGTVDCTSGTFTVTLPTAVGITGHEFTIVNSGSGAITIATTSSQTFTNITSTPTTLSLAAVGAGAIVSYTVISNGANWIVTGKVKNE
jgi:hypothetical protein